MADYNLAERLLHRLALGSTAICEAQFDIECAVEKPKADPDGRHVFVAGLARAGTTILMRSIFESGAFGTLTYRDMPFVMAPNLWTRLHRRSSRTIAAAERAHGDGILVDADSPEALEEVFWRVYAGHDYLGPAHAGLEPHELSQDTVDAFRKYVALILKKADASRYLSKNNNNILRIDGLLKAFPSAQILIPFRHPADHARSLLGQHGKFMKDNDPFTRKYMGWLAHHEFGPDHRPFAFPEVSLGTSEPSDPDYWAALWGGVYAHLFSRYKSAERVHFLCFETLSTDPAMWIRLADLLDLPKGSPSEFRPQQRPPGAEISSELESLYAKMVDASV